MKLLDLFRKNGSLSKTNQHKTLVKGNKLTIEEIITDLRRAMSELDNSRRTAIVSNLASHGMSSALLLKLIILDKSLDMYLRRYALEVGSGCNDPGYNDFIKTNLITGVSKARLMEEYYSGTTDGSALALYVRGEEILETPDFFSRFMTK